MSKGEGAPRMQGQVQENMRRVVGPCRALVDGKSPRNAKGAMGLSETRVAMVTAGLWVMRLAGRLVNAMPLKTSLLGCPNQSAKFATLANTGFATRAAPGVCPPGGMPPPLPTGV